MVFAYVNSDTVPESVISPISVYPFQKQYISPIVIEKQWTSHESCRNMAWRISIGTVVLVSIRATPIVFFVLLFVPWASRPTIILHTPKKGVREVLYTD
jgi:hypothetical protein